MTGEPINPTTGMMTMPTLGGAAHLAELVHVYGGEARAAADFRIAPELLRSYLSGVMECPLATFLAIYWQGPYGFSQAMSETHWVNVANVARAKFAEAKLDQMRTFIRHLAPHVEGFGVLARSYGIEDTTALLPIGGK